MSPLISESRIVTNAAREDSGRAARRCARQLLDVVAANQAAEPVADDVDPAAGRSVVKVRRQQLVRRINLPSRAGALA